MPTFDDAMAEIAARDDLRTWLDAWHAVRQVKADPVLEAVERAVLTALEHDDLWTVMAFRVVARCRAFGRSDVAAAVLLESEEVRGIPAHTRN